MLLTTKTDQILGKILLKEFKVLIPLIAVVVILLKNIGKNEMESIDGSYIHHILGLVLHL